MQGTEGPAGQQPRLAWLADVLDRFLLVLVVISAAAGIAFPGPGRHIDARGAILDTLAVLVFCTGASMTFREIAAIPAASRRLILVLAVTTVTLPALAWAASRLVTSPVLRGGVLAAGVAPTEVASVALTGLASGEVALAAGLLVASTVLTVLLAGPTLGILGAHSSASQLGLLATLALVVALPLVAGSAMRTLDPLSGREQPVVRVLGTVSLLVLLGEVASELHLRASDTRVVLALLLYLAGGATLGWLLAIGVPPRRRTAIVLPTAMRDFAVAAGIATSAFGAAAAAPSASTASWSWSSAPSPSTRYGDTEDDTGPVALLLADAHAGPAMRLDLLQVPAGQVTGPAWPSWVK